MPPKKKAGVDVFVSEYRKKYFPQASCSDMGAIEAARSAWKHLPMEEKEYYELEAKRNSRKMISQKGGEYQRTGFGENVKMEEIRRQDNNLWRRNVAKTMLNAVQKLGPPGNFEALLDVPFVFGFANGVDIREKSLSRRSMFVPTEIALLKFTLRDAVSSEAECFFPTSASFFGGDEDDFFIDVADKEHSLGLQMSDVPVTISGSEMADKIVKFCTHSKRLLPIFTYSGVVTSLYTALSQLFANTQPVNIPEPYFQMHRLQPTRMENPDPTVAKDVDFCHYEELDDIPCYWTQGKMDVWPAEMMAAGILEGSRYATYPDMAPPSVESINSLETYAKNVLETLLPRSLAGIEACETHQKNDASNSCAMKSALVSIVGLFVQLHTLKSPYTASLETMFVPEQTYAHIVDWMKQKTVEEEHQKQLERVPAVLATMTLNTDPPSQIGKVTSPLESKGLGRGFMSSRAGDTAMCAPGSMRAGKKKILVPSFLDDF